ncbi:MAG: hypothetical protein ABW168_01360, partial [Sedimenticola sp.]
MDWLDGWFMTAYCQKRVRIPPTNRRKKKRQPFVTHLIEKGLVSSRKVAESASHEFGAPLFDLDVLDFDAIPTDLVAEELVRKHHALPLF